MTEEIEARKHAEQLAAGFSAAVFGLFLTNLSLDSRSSEADYSLWLLCISMPMMIVWWMHFHSTIWRYNFITKAACAIGYVGGLLGIGLTIFHVNQLAVVAFVVAAIAAVAIGTISEDKGSNAG